MVEAIPASNDVNLPGLATTETLTRHVNLNYFSEAVSWEGEERLADADSWRITGNPQVIVLGRISIDKRASSERPIGNEKPTVRTVPQHSLAWPRRSSGSQVSVEAKLAVAVNPVP